MKINLIIIILISFFSTGIYAQLDDNLKAKLYFTEAEKLFKQGDFKNSLVYVDKAEVTLGAPVARTLALRIKLAYNLGHFTEAKTLFDIYTSGYMKEASKELNDEVLAMFINIEEAAEAEKKRQAEVKAAEERRKAEHERRLAEEARKAKEAEQLELKRKQENEARIAEEKKNRIVFKIDGIEMEVYKENFGKMNWFEAIIACEKLGGGWRLPSKEELRQIYYQLYKNGKGNFMSTDYWSSNDSWALNAWSFNFATGKARGTANGKYYKHYVRAVRAL